MAADAETARRTGARLPRAGPEATSGSIKKMTLLITGAAGFIGANFVLDWLAQSDEPVINLDKLTYAGNLETLASLQDDARH
jgi:FlaA1/EpsC-like NDP-sugar epimerase